jgi:hypothetical protein
LFSFSSYDSVNKSNKPSELKWVASNATSSLESRCKSFYATLDQNHFSLPNFDVFLATGFFEDFAGFFDGMNIKNY